MVDLYDLEEYLDNVSGGTRDEKRFLLSPSVKFQLVFDENIVPPLELLEHFLNRELILKSGRVICQKKLKTTLLFDKIKASLAIDELEKDSVPMAKDGNDVEYEDVGTLPEGLFLFEDYFPVLHVGKDGIIKQLDLMKEKNIVEEEIKPINNEFKNILIKKHMEHKWEELMVKFVPS